MVVVMDGQVEGIWRDMWEMHRCMRCMDAWIGKSLCKTRCARCNGKQL